LGSSRHFLSIRRKDVATQDLDTAAFISAFGVRLSVRLE